MIAGGGTGGHIVPSLQIARALVARGHAAESIELYGSRRGQEATTWPTLEFPYTLLPRSRASGAACGPPPGGPTSGRCSGWPGPACAPSARSCARRPRVVVVVGGYASFPAGLAAVLTRVPLVCSDHRRRARRRQRPARPLRRRQRRGLRRHGPAPGPRHRHAGAARARRPATGRPRGRPPAGRRWACRPTATTVACAGGSLGARQVNRAVADLAEAVGRLRRPLALPRHRPT